MTPILINKTKLTTHSLVLKNDVNNKRYILDGFKIISESIKTKSY